MIIIDDCLSIVFQFIDTIDCLIRICNCNKQFYKVYKQPNSWSFSFLSLRSKKSFRMIFCISKVPMLRQLDLNLSIGFTTQEFRVLCTNLKFLPLLTSFTLSYNFYYQQSTAQDLAEHLSFVPLLNILNLSYNGISDDSCCTIFAHLRSVSVLNTLNLSGNRS